VSRPASLIRSVARRFDNPSYAHFDAPATLLARANELIE
jgi:hypothetical protein